MNPPLPLSSLDATNLGSLLCDRGGRVTHIPGPLDHPSHTLRAPSYGWDVEAPMRELGELYRAALVRVE